MRTDHQALGNLEAPRNPNRAERRWRMNRLNNYGNPVGMGRHTINKLGKTVFSDGTGKSGLGLFRVKTVRIDQVSGKRIKSYEFSSGAKPRTLWSENHHGMTPADLRRLAERAR